MATFASALIDALGGTTEAASFMDASISTVHRMRSHPTASRLNHLCRVARMEVPSLNVAALAAEHGVAALPTGSSERSSSGNVDDLSVEVAA